MDERRFRELLEETRAMVKENKHIAVHAYMMDVFQDAVEQCPTLAVELGVRQGLSTRTLARALSLFDGTLVSCDVQDYSRATDYKKWIFVLNEGVKLGTGWRGFALDHNLKTRIDILYFDTTEKYDEVRAEITAWFPHLEESCTVFFSCSNLKHQLVYEDGTKTGLGWDNQRGVIRALQEHFQVKFDESKEWDGWAGEWWIKHRPWGGGWTTCRRGGDDSSILAA